MTRLAAVLLLGLVLVACGEPPGVRQPIPITPPQDAATAPVVRKDVAPPAPSPATAALAPVIVPPGVQYVCVVDQDGARRQTTIEFTDRKVADLCAKHPEMGPCQYERDVCRRSGGRVYAANNVEITRDTEAEYDKKVMRVRFKAN
jgi:hypothetical protein